MKQGMLLLQSALSDLRRKMQKPQGRFDLTCERTCWLRTETVLLWQHPGKGQQAGMGAQGEC